MMVARGDTSFRRYEAFGSIVDLLRGELVVCNLGSPSQELYSLGDSEGFLYMLGSMGLASSIGLGISLGTPKRVVALDGDGSVLMNLGTLPTIGRYGPTNYTLLVVDNGTYGSTGDQPTLAGSGADLAAIARASGVRSVFETRGEDLAEAFTRTRALPGPHVIVCQILPGGPACPPIPLSPVALRDRFMRALRS
jgi:sulfopyruvate decarboxylase subunit beta